MATLAGVGVMDVTIITRLLSTVTVLKSVKEPTAVVAVMVAVPFAIPVTTPVLALTVATRITSYNVCYTKLLRYSTGIMNDDLKKALEVLQDGGTILYPTDTVWGIGCDATHPEAVKKVYQIKQREDSKSMLVLVDSEVRLERYVAEVPEVAWQLIEVADKPMTLIYPGAKNLAANLIAPDGSIGIRLVKDDLVDEVYLTVAPVLLGGRTAPTPIEGEGFSIV